MSAEDNVMVPKTWFDPAELERANRLIGVELNALPFGVIAVDRKGTIIEYNDYESSLSGLKRENVVGRNFFHDVAPCTAIKEFEGRFETWLDSHDTSIEPFHFVFKFPGRQTNVSIVFIRTNFDSDRANICVVLEDKPVDP
jgi:photoactive yellow protein